MVVSILPASDVGSFREVSYPQGLQPLVFHHPDAKTLTTQDTGRWKVGHCLGSSYTTRRCYNAQESYLLVHWWYYHPQE